MNNEMLYSGRFNNQPKNIDNKRRLLRKKPRTPPVAYKIIGVDSTYFTNDEGTYPLDCYAIDTDIKTYTLTRKEADILALSFPGSQPPIALEQVHPWLPKNKFINNSKYNYSNLKALIKKYFKHIPDTTDLSNQYWNAICNKIRFTSTLDMHYYHAWCAPIQEAYMLKDNRPNRTIVAVDFNSMYAACMQKKYPSPKKYSLIKYNRFLVSNEELPIGLYKCKLNGEASLFIKKYNPFRVFFSGKYLGLSLDAGVELYLNEFEVYFYRKHFQSIYIEEAIISEKEIAHPLAAEAKRSYAKRTSYASQGNDTLAALEKFKLVVMASCTNRPSILSRKFPSIKAVYSFLKDELYITPYPKEPIDSTLHWLDGRKGIALKQKKDHFQLKTHNTNNGSACFSLYQRTVAYSRIALLSLMEKLTTLFPEVEICYCNIDSIHFSFNKKDELRILKYLKKNASDEMGGYKIEAVARHGLWLEPGRYWLYDDSIKKYANKGLRNEKYPLNEFKTFIKNIKVDGFSIPVKRTISLANSLSDLLSIEEGCRNAVYLRKILLSSDTSYLQVMEEIRSNNSFSADVKMSAFNEMKNLLLNK